MQNLNTNEGNRIRKEINHLKRYFESAGKIMHGELKSKLDCLYLEHETSYICYCFRLQLGLERPDDKRQKLLAPVWISSHLMTTTTLAKRNTGSS